MYAAQRGPGRLAAERLEIQPGVAEGQVAGAGVESRRGLVPEVPVSIGVAGRGTSVRRRTKNTLENGKQEKKKKGR
jgi:hypothetical protein